MFKKAYAILLTLCVMANLTACGETKELLAESRTLLQFTNVANHMNLTMLDKSVQFEADERFENVYIAIETTDNKDEILWQVEHYTIRDEKEADLIYDQQCELAKDALKEGKITANSYASHRKSIQIVTDTVYFYMEQAEDIIILAETDIKHMQKVKGFFENLDM